MRSKEPPAAPPPDANPRPIGAAESLDDLAREAAAEAPPEAEPMQPGEVVMPSSPNEGLVLGCIGLVSVIGNLVCARAGVSELARGEAEAVGRALAGVAVYYLPTDGDPRLMAWATLALAVGSVAAPRLREARERDAQPSGA